MIDTRSTDPVAAVVEICAEHDVQTIVVGLAVSLSGEEGAAAVAAREFGSLVSEATGGNLVYWDERFTSVQAEQALLESGMRRDKRRETRDKVAASFMLQGYLDSVNAGRAMSGRQVVEYVIEEPPPEEPPRRPWWLAMARVAVAITAVVVVALIAYRFTQNLAERVGAVDAGRNSSSVSRSPSTFRRGPRHGGSPRSSLRPG